MGHDTLIADIKGIEIIQTIYKRHASHWEKKSHASEFFVLTLKMIEFLK